MANVNPNSIGWDFKQLTSGKGDKKFGEGTEGGNGNGNGDYLITEVEDGDYCCVGTQYLMLDIEVKVVADAGKDYCGEGKGTPAVWPSVGRVWNKKIINQLTRIGDWDQEWGILTGNRAPSTAKYFIQGRMSSIRYSNCLQKKCPSDANHDCEEFVNKLNKTEKVKDLLGDVKLQLLLNECRPPGIPFWQGGGFGRIQGLDPRLRQLPKSPDRTGGPSLWSASLIVETYLKRLGGWDFSNDSCFPPSEGGDEEKKSGATFDECWVFPHPYDPKASGQAVIQDIPDRMQPKWDGGFLAKCYKLKACRKRYCILECCETPECEIDNLAKEVTWKKKCDIALKYRQPGEPGFNQAYYDNVKFRNGGKDPRRGKKVSDKITLGQFCGEDLQACLEGIWKKHAIAKGQTSCEGFVLDQSDPRKGPSDPGMAFLPCCMEI